MSWASKEPEKYDELTREGIEQYLSHLLGDRNYFSVSYSMQLKELIDAIQVLPELRGLYIELQRLASVDIMKAEQDYFGGLADQASSKHG